MDALLAIALVVTMTLHLAAVGVAGFGPLVAWGLDRRARRRGDAVAGRLGKRLVGQSMAALGLGMVLGVAVVGLSWGLYSVAFFDIFRAVPRSRLWFGLGELA